jgi:hypothetical protein
LFGRRITNGWVLWPVTGCRDYNYVCFQGGSYCLLETDARTCNRRDADYIRVIGRGPLNPGCQILRAALFKVRLDTHRDYLGSRGDPEGAAASALSMSRNQASHQRSMA